MIDVHHVNTSAVTPTIWMQEENGEWSNVTVADDNGERAEWLVMLDHASTIIMTCNTVTLMLGMGAATYWKEIWQHMKRPWGCIIGLICQFVLLPAVGFGLCIAMSLPPYEALGVLILTCSPGGAFSNFFTYWVDGDLALSIIMTSLSALLAFGAMPLNLWAYTQQWTKQDLYVPYFNILISLIFVTVPTIIGMFIRHNTRKWATYISKVCGVLGWVGAITCGVLLILTYWDVIKESSINLVITSALVPLGGVIIAYILAKIVCFSHKVCRTVAIETGCQNMVVATNIMLLSFSNHQIRGQMIIFPVLYGLCQLAEILIAVALFQIWKFIHRDDVTEEVVLSVIDNSILTSVPVPAHKLSQTRIQKMTGQTTTPDLCKGQHNMQHRTHKRFEESPYNTWETESLSTQRPQAMNTTHELEENQNGALDDLLNNLNAPLNPYLSSASAVARKSYNPNVFIFPENTERNPLLSLEKTNLPPMHLRRDKHQSPETESSHSPCSTPPEDPERISWNHNLLYSSNPSISEFPSSPSLSNKGVPNMFPVTENDFPLPRDDSPIPYGSPIPVCRGNQLRNSEITKIPEEYSYLDNNNGLVSPENNSPTSPRSPSTSQTFGFYHNDVLLGQTQQFSAFIRK